MQDKETSRREFVKRIAVAATATVAASAGVAASTESMGAEARGTGETRLYHETEEWRKYYAKLR
mgnify:CR=1 FL=1